MKARRLAKLNSFIREEIAKLLLRDIKDPRIGFVTIIRAEVTNDCQFVDIYFSVLGSDSQKRTTMRALQDCSGHLSCEVGKKLDIRNTPRCRFVLDESIEKQIRIEQLIKGAVEDTHRNEEIRKANHLEKQIHLEQLLKSTVENTDQNEEIREQSNDTPSEEVKN